MIQILKSCLQKKMVRILGVNLNFEKTVFIIINPITLNQIVLANNAKMTTKRNCCSRTKSPVKSFNQYFKAYHNQIHPIEQLSFYAVNYFSRISYDSRNRSSSKNHYTPYRSLVLNQLQLYVDHLKNFVLDIVILIEKSVPIDLYHIQDRLNIVSNKKTLDLLTIFFQK